MPASLLKRTLIWLVSKLNVMSSSWIKKDSQRSITLCSVTKVFNSLVGKSKELLLLELWLEDLKFFSLMKLHQLWMLKVNFKSRNLLMLLWKEDKWQSSSLLIDYLQLETLMLFVFLIKERLLKEEVIMNLSRWTESTKLLLIDSSQVLSLLQPKFQERKTLQRRMKKKNSVVKKRKFLKMGNDNFSFLFKKK